MQPLNAREWLESLRLVSDCRFIPELLELVDYLPDLSDAADCLEDIARYMPEPETAQKLRFENVARFAEKVCERLELLDSLETIISENVAGMTWPNGTEPVDIDDKLQAAFDSGRWLTYDL